jgi:hypothetical protein
MPVGAQDAARIGALADPVRRRRYLFACSQPVAVGGRTGSGAGSSEG